MKLRLHWLDLLFEPLQAPLERPKFRFDPARDPFLDLSDGGMDFFTVALAFLRDHLCLGEGAVYRAVAALQREFFDPPTFGKALWGIDEERPIRKRSPGR